MVVLKSSCLAVVCHRRQPLDCLNHPAEYLQCTQLVSTGRLDSEDDVGCRPTNRGRLREL